MNRRFNIRRSNMLAALGLGKDLPRKGWTAEYTNVSVVVGDWPIDKRPDWLVGPEEVVILPKVVVKPEGIANRIQAECPKCGKMMRFSGLRQHVGTKVCRKRERDRIIAWLVWNDPNGVYTDEDSAAEGGAPITLEAARAIKAEMEYRAAAKEGVTNV